MEFSERDIEDYLENNELLDSLYGVEQPSRGETMKPVYGGYQHSFNSYSHTIWGKGAKG